MKPPSLKVLITEIQYFSFLQIFNKKLETHQLVPMKTYEFSILLDKLRLNDSTKFITPDLCIKLQHCKKNTCFFYQQ